MPFQQKSHFSSVQAALLSFEILPVRGSFRIRGVERIGASLIS